MQQTDNAWDHRNSTSSLRNATTKTCRSENRWTTTTNRITVTNKRFVHLEMKQHNERVSWRAASQKYACTLKTVPSCFQALKLNSKQLLVHWYITGQFRDVFLHAINCTGTYNSQLYSEKHTNKLARNKP